MKLRLVPTLFLAAITAGCSHSLYSPPLQETDLPSTQTPPRANTGEIKNKIYSQYRAWKGTRYALGGLSKRGIDCSGLVYTTYRDHLGVELPRTTRYQAQAGKAIKRSDLRAGDLVFFKTSYKVRHVGIYIEDNKFFHASTSKGVTISKLNDYYWRDKYWHARRLELKPYRIPLRK